MRTLLVDNYDSFTYNLFHYLAEVNGREPTVIRNDEPGWHASRLSDFDNVVISPGPGTPERGADFGLCRELVDHCRLPLLGVCLGHQGIALAHGAKVSPAPEVRHGRVSPVFHNGADLFAGLPSPFDAVRYHSLAVEDLTADLEAVAWTADGVLMGLRHRHRPLWGVQFHPESICTADGRLLLSNFRDLTLQRPRAQRPEAQRPGAERPDAGPSTRPAQQLGATRPGCAVPEPEQRRLALTVRHLPLSCAAESVFDRLFLASEHAFWLDSSRPDPLTGRFSMMGDASGPLARVAVADVWTGQVTVTGADGTRIHTGGFLDWLEQDLRSARIEAPELPFDFALGWVGYLGYELKAECGGERVHRSTEPDAAMVFADRAVVFDHGTGTVYLLALSEDGHEQPATDWLHRTEDALRALESRQPDLDEAPPTGRRTPLSLRHQREHYLELIGTCLDAITAGETYEVCLTNRIAAGAPAATEAWTGYRFLRRASPAPFGALLRFGPLAVLSTSPERFLRIDRDRLVESKPIKGTRPRGRTPEEDEQLRAELALSEKDRAENLMIVDLVRNDLGRCAEVGSVEVHRLFDVETFATVHQLVSTVRARLRADSSAVGCVRAAFPGGSMTGAPKIRTMRIIDELEGGPRGVYSGAIGYFSLSGAADLSIVIRTLVLGPEGARYGVGGAIVSLSDPEEEYEETAVKATPLLRLLATDFPDR
ncbi:aminodeoxychorismate synthase component I [Streptacidiphilus sp. EB129]|uniref:aminodeoxychorismate synthase component I n=1 Tax=Streptacidiphilus sp. EB129 TaxID=3156262 RepID=UPI0035180C2D